MEGMDLRKKTFAVNANWICIRLWSSFYSHVSLYSTECADFQNCPLQILKSYRDFKSEFLQIRLRNAGIWIFLSKSQCQSMPFEKKEAVALARKLLQWRFYHFLVKKDLLPVLFGLVKHCGLTWLATGIWHAASVAPYKKQENLALLPPCSKKSEKKNLLNL